MNDPGGPSGASDSSDAPAGPVLLTKAQASARHAKLLKSAGMFQEEDDFFARYLGIVRDILHAYPVANSSAATPAVFSDSMEVYEIESYMLPSASVVYTDDYFSRPTYPLKALCRVAELHGSRDVVPGFMDLFVLSQHELENKGIMNQVWLAYMLGMGPAEARSIIDMFNEARSISVRSIRKPTEDPVIAPQRDPGSSQTHASPAAARNITGR
eukprot:IDg187t1